MVRELDFADGFESSTAPSVGLFNSGGLNSYASDAAYVTAKGSAATAGDMYHNSSSGQVREFDGTVWREMVAATGAQTIAGNKTFSNDVTVQGDLTVNGTTTTINTATLDVEDSNITVNKGGNTATADAAGAGVTVEVSDGTDAALSYDSSLTSFFKIGEIGSQKEVLTVSDTQLITEKDIDGGIASDDRRITVPKGTTAALAALTRKEGTIVYDTDVESLFVDDGTNLKEVGSGGGSGAFQACFLVSTSNIALSGEQTIDGVLTSATRILVAGQSTPSQNGIYVTAAGAWTRATDLDEDAEVIQGMQVYVVDGTTHGHSTWVLRTDGPFVVGTTGLSFVKLNEWNKQSITLNGTDITNQYVNLDYEAIPSTMDLYLEGVAYHETDDYTLSVSGGVTRLTFAGQLASTGNAGLVEGQILKVKYQIKRNN